MTSKKFTREQLVKSAEKASQEKPLLAAILSDLHVDEVVPEGWYTLREIAAGAGQSESNTQKILAKKVLDGKYLYKDIAILRDGRRHKVRHYTIKK